MGRHSRGGAGSPPPEPEPTVPAAPRYEPRSAEDTGVWDRSTYRVVDVGLPPGSSAAPVSFPLGGAPAGGRPLRSVPERGRRGGATRADLVDPEPGQPGPRSNPGVPSRHRPAESGLPPLSTNGRRPASSPGLPPLGTNGRRAAPGPAGTGRGYDPGAGRGYDTGSGLAPLGPGRAFDTGNGRTADTGGGLAPLGTGRAFDTGNGRTVDTGSGLAPLGTARPYDSGLRPPADAPRAFALDPAPHPLDQDVRRSAESSSGPRPLNTYGSRDDERPTRAAGRFGATRADLAGDTLGATALAPREAPEPDEVTDTGARRARSTFRVAEAPVEDAAKAEDEDYDEPSLLVQWGVFVAQTLTGAVAGLGVWLGFYRLWSTWPFYAAPAVGLAAILMLVAARTLRRRHGHDLDLMTAIVTIGISTVLTVLPATFTLQNLA